MSVKPKYVNKTNPDGKSHRRQLAEGVNQSLDIINSVQSVTLDASTVRTQFSNSQINPDSAVVFTAKNGNAAGELASGSMYIDTVDPSASTFDIVHSSTATAVFTYNIAIIG